MDIFTFLILLLIVIPSQVLIFICFICLHQKYNRYENIAINILDGFNQNDSTNKYLNKNKQIKNTKNHSNTNNKQSKNSNPITNESFGEFILLLASGIWRRMQNGEFDSF